jgi:3-mercaptopyruvate sulfurtransferase SseA
LAWSLRYFGHGNVRVLNGGLKKWTAEKRIVESGLYKAIDKKLISKEKKDYEYYVVN